MTTDPWTTTTGDDPVLATAIHAGHDLRDEVAALMRLPEADRLREEDPFTDRWVDIAPTRSSSIRSRFEVDINRDREKAVYRVPEDAWGLDIWRTEPSDDLLAGSLALYDRFYEELGELCDRIIENHGRVVVLDLHSYNHRRLGPDRPVDDPELNPEINLGTKTDRGHILGAGRRGLQLHDARRSVLQRATSTFEPTSSSPVRHDPLDQRPLRRQGLLDRGRDEEDLHGRVVR